MLRRVSSAISMRSATRARPSALGGAAPVICASCASPNQPPAEQRLVEDALQPGGGVGDDLLRVDESLGVAGQRRDGGVDLLGGEAAGGHFSSP